MRSRAWKSEMVIMVFTGFRRQRYELSDKNKNFAAKNDRSHFPKRPQSFFKTTAVVFRNERSRFQNGGSIFLPLPVVYA